MSSDLDNNNRNVKWGWIGRFDGWAGVINLFFIGVLILFFAFYGMQFGGFAPLLQGENETKAQINKLEIQMEHNPSNVPDAVKLAKLYEQVGEFPWSYNTLKSAEEASATGNKQEWQVKIGLAYLELGKTEDALRVFQDLKKKCSSTHRCREDVLVKIDIFHQLTEKFVERKIDARKHNAAAVKALQEIIKTVRVEAQPNSSASNRPNS